MGRPSRPRRPGRRGPVRPDWPQRLRASAQVGRANAAAARAHRLLEAELARVGLGAKPFDATMLALLAQVGAHAAPWLPPDRLHLVNRASLWIFGIDWLIDRQAGSVDEVDEVVGRSLAVLDGAAGTDAVGELLAGLRTDLHARSRDATALAAWAEEARRVLRAMRREWDWRDGPVPSADAYMSNVDSVGLRFAFVTLLVADGATAEDWRPGPGTISEAADATARVLRMINDVGGQPREQAFGDVNLLSLGPTRAQIEADIRAGVARCLRLFARQRPAHQRWAGYLERVIGFNSGLYGTADYWGEA